MYCCVFQCYFSPLKLKAQHSGGKKGYSVLRILTTFSLRNSLLIVLSIYKLKKMQNSDVPISHRGHYMIILLYLNNARGAVKGLLSHSKL